MRDITHNINYANAWLLNNRPNHNMITMERVAKRLKTGGLLSVESDAKTVKGSKQGFLTGILYFAPHKVCGLNLCPFAKTCIKDCLFNAGRGRFANVTEARIIKTLAWMHDPKAFKARLIKDIQKLVAKAKAEGLTPVVRLNGTSDILIERAFADVLMQFRTVQFYDYTKNPNRFDKLPSNYDLTFSFDGVNIEKCKEILTKGIGRVAVVFKDRLPDTFMGFKVIDGDSSDLRFLDPEGVIVGLVAKGSAKSDQANQSFVIDPATDRRCAA